MRFEKPTQDELNAEPLQAVSYIRPMIGKSGAALWKANDDALYVVKTCGDLLHPNALANEFLATAICMAVGLPVAMSRTIELTERSLDALALLAHHEEYALRAKPGFHYASRLIMPPHPNQAFVIEHLSRHDAKTLDNRHDFLGMYLLDLCFKHRAHRKAVCIKRKKESSCHAIFIDHDQMFGGSNWDTESPAIYHHHRTVSLYHGLLSKKDVSSWLRTLTDKLPSAVDSAVTHLPSEWHTGNLTRLHAWLHHRIESLPDLADQQLARDPIFNVYVDSTMHLQSSPIC